MPDDCLACRSTTALSDQHRSSSAAYSLEQSLKTEINGAPNKTNNSKRAARQFDGAVIGDDLAGAPH
jgi:hypothetical protein